VLDVPASLSKEQEEVVDELSKVMNGDPRAKLFPAGRGRPATGRERGPRGLIDGHPARPHHPHRDPAIAVEGRSRRVHDLRGPPSWPRCIRRPCGCTRARGLIEPKRSPKGTRLYSHADVEQLRRIQEMTAELGMNLAGVERVFELEGQIERMTQRMEALERRAEQIEAEMAAEVERVRREFRAEIVPYRPPPGGVDPREGSPANAHSGAPPRPLDLSARQTFQFRSPPDAPEA